MKKHIGVGLGAGLALVFVYLGIVTLAQGLGHALDQTSQLWYWVLALAGGFGVQAGLFSFIRAGLRERRAAATASIATSGGISAGSMAACCAHHLSDLLPIMGLSGLTLFLVRYQLFFIVAGVLSNAVGITIMLETLQHHALSPRLRGWNLGRVKRGTMLTAAVVLLITFFVTS